MSDVLMISQEQLEDAAATPESSREFMRTHFRAVPEPTTPIGFSLEPIQGVVFPGPAPEPLVGETFAVAAAHGAGGGDVAASIEKFFQRFRYRRKKKSGAPVVVVEGDSWFSHPLIQDVANQLESEYAVLNLSHPGDELTHIRASLPRTVATIGEVRPAAVLLGGGGNDTIGTHFKKWLRAPEGDEEGERYLNRDAFEVHMKSLRRVWTEILEGVLSVSGAAPIVIHGYSYALPVPFEDKKNRRVSGIGREPWLSGALDDLGVKSDSERCRIVRIMVNALNEVLAGLSNDRPQVRYVNVRTALVHPAGDRYWYDELHPNDAGFDLVASYLSRSLP